MNLIRHLFKEPLAGFALIAGVIFLLYTLVNKHEPPSIEVSQTIIDKLIEEREMVLERNLNQAERSAIRQRFIDQEVLVREGLARGLHLQDGKIRHRLADKMMFLIADEPIAPSDEQLNEFYLQHLTDYSSPPLVNFDHVFFSDQAAAVIALPKLIADEDSIEIVGNHFWMGNQLQRMTAQDVVTIMGRQFAVAIDSLPLQQWSGPLQSTRGWHLVKMTQRIPAAPIPREQLQQRLYQEWMGAQRSQLRRNAIDTLIGNYSINTVP